MNEKRATTILLLIFAAVFVYSVFMRDTADDSALAFQGQLARDRGQVVSFEQAPQSHEQQFIAAIASGSTAPGPFATRGSSSSSPLTGAAVRSFSNTPSNHKKLLFASFESFYQGKHVGSSTPFYHYLQSLQSQGGKKK